MGLGGEKRQKSAQAELPLKRRGALRNRPPDGEGGRARQRKSGVAASEAEQGQSRQRRDDRGSADAVSGRALAGSARAAARRDLPAEAGKATADSEEGRRGPGARDPVRARPDDPAGRPASLAADLRPNF